MHLSHVELLRQELTGTGNRNFDHVHDVIEIVGIVLGRVDGCPHWHCVVDRRPHAAVRTAGAAGVALHRIDVGWITKPGWAAVLGVSGYPVDCAQEVIPVPCAVADVARPLMLKAFEVWRAIYLAVHYWSVGIVV